MAIEAHDFVSTSPTNVFATFNVLTEPNVSTGHTFSDGNLKLAFSTAPLIFPSVLGSIAIPNDSGVWYWEVHLTTANNTGLGVYNENTNLTTDYGSYQSGLTDAGFIKFGGSSLQKVYLNTITEIANSLSSPIIFQFIFNAVNRKLFIKYNNTEPSGQSISSGTSLFPVFSAGKTYIPAFYHGDGGSGTKSGTFIINHGQDHTFGGYPNSLASSSGYSDANGIGSFYYDPTAIDSEALALCTANLPDPAIDPNKDDLPEDFFKSTLYSGSTSAALDHDTGLKADLVWVKKRNNTERHLLVDSVRGGNSTSNFVLYPDLGVAQEYDNVNNYNWGTLTTSATANSRFQVDANQGYANDAHNFVCWGWRAGGSPSGSNIYMKDGTGYTNSTSDKATVFGSASNYTITPTAASIGTKQGFSIIKYTGPGTNTAGTLPHGLGKEPEFIITKSTDQDYNWMTYHKSAGTTHYCELNLSVAFSNNSLNYNGPHDANVIKYGGSAVVANGDYIVYAFTSIEGYSAFGSWSSNADSSGPPADGNFIFTGFKPSWIMMKATNRSSFTTYASWLIFDNVRSPHNAAKGDNTLYANRSYAEGKRGEGSSASGEWVDFLSNGFKIRTDAAEIGGAGHSGSIIYASFAEMPFKYSATNAR